MKKLLPFLIVTFVFSFITFFDSVGHATPATTPDAAVSGGALQLTFQIDQVTTSGPGTVKADGSTSKESEKKTVQSTHIVTLYPNMVTDKSDKQQTIYDFMSGKMIMLNLENKTYMITSIYAVPMFKVMEKGNQAMLFGKLMEKVDFPNKVRPFDLDMKFGGKVEATAADLKSASDAGQTSFTYKDEAVANYKLSETSVPEALKKSYQHYLAYTMAVHPAIYQSLKDQGKVFQTLHFVNKSMAPLLDDLTFTLIKAEAVPDTPLPALPVDFQPNPEVGAAYATIISKLGTLPPYETAISEIQRLYVEKKYLDAAILFQNYTLVYGYTGLDTLKPLLQSLFKNAPPDSQAREVTAICSAQPDKKTAAQMIEKIKEIQALSPERGYLLNSCLAVYVQATGDVGEAQKLRLELLEKNPYTIGAMKDLGDGYYMKFDTFRAWAYWNLGRQINASHPLFGNIDQMEQRLRSEMPDYF